MFMLVGLLFNFIEVQIIQFALFCVGFSHLIISLWDLSVLSTMKALNLYFIHNSAEEVLVTLRSILPTLSLSLSIAFLTVHPHLWSLL